MIKIKIKKTCIFLLCWIIMVSAQAQFKNLTSFAKLSGGSLVNPKSVVSDGTYLYAVTSSGGANHYSERNDGLGNIIDANYGSGPVYGDGMLIKVKTDGTGYAKCLDFSGISGSIGSRPLSLVKVGDYIYGIAVDGGTLNKGTIFKYKIDGTFSGVIHNFGGNTNNDGEAPAQLITDGTYLYGTTAYGGPSSGPGAGYGVLFSINTNGTGYRIVQNFNASNRAGHIFTDGSYLYGTTSAGSGSTVIINKMQMDGTGSAQLMAVDGSVSISLSAYDGNYLYGVGDSASHHTGFIFKIKPDGSSYSKIYTLCNYSGLNQFSCSNLALYDSVLNGAYADANSTWGTIFKINTNGTSYIKLYEHYSSGPDVASLIIPGNVTYYNNCIYGVQNQGGAYSGGAVFKCQAATCLTPSLCGTTLAKLSTGLTCVPISGATNYEWEVTDTTTHTVYTKRVGSSTTVLYLTQISQCTYGKTYRIRIRPYIGVMSTWGSFGTSCTVNSPVSIPLTSLSGSQCGTTLAKLSTALTCASISGATNYEWEVTDTTTHAVYTMQVGNTTVLYLTQIPQCTYGKTYRIRIRPYIGAMSTWGSFGTSCTVNTPAAATNNPSPAAADILNENDQNRTINITDANPLSYFSLYPNPVIYNSIIDFKLNKTSSVKMEVYNFSGQRIEILYDGYAEADQRYSVLFNAENLSSGIYFVKLSAGISVQTKQIAVVKP